MEDRGPIGAGGVHLFQIRVANDPYDDDVVEMPEDVIEVVDPDACRPDPITSREAVKYLKYGGLIRILRVGMSGGKMQPSAWLCRDSLGNVTHTFSSERGLVGGKLIPFLALHGHRVFKPKRDEVLDFLMTAFKLSKDEAKHVLQKVKTAP